MNNVSFYLGCLKCRVMVPIAPPDEVRAFLWEHREHLDEVRPMQMQDVPGDTIKIKLPLTE